MKQADFFIFSGLLILLFGLNNESGQLISSDSKLTIGVASFTYGILLYLLANKNIKEFTFGFPGKLSEIPAKVYLGLGVLILRLDRFLTFISDNMTFSILKFIIGMIILVYGLHKFFIEKRMKRESGNIEK